MAPENVDRMATITKSIKDHISSHAQRRDKELHEIQKRFGKAMKELPQAIEASGGPKATDLEAIGQTVGRVRTSGYKKVYRDMAEAHGAAIDKALQSADVSGEQPRKDLLKIVDVAEESWAPDRYLTGWTGLSLTQNRKGD